MNFNDLVTQILDVAVADRSKLDLEDSEKSEKSISELSSDRCPAENAGSAGGDSGAVNALNQTMIIKSEAQLKEDLAEEISKSILEQLIHETISTATDCLSLKTLRIGRKNASVDVLQRVNVLLSGGRDTGGHRSSPSSSSQMYMTTAFDIFSSSSEDQESASDELELSVSSPAGSSQGTPLVDVVSAQDRYALAAKLNDLQIENDDDGGEWIDDDLEVAAFSPSSANSSANDSHVKVIVRPKIWFSVFQVKIVAFKSNFFSLFTFNTLDINLTDWVLMRTMVIGWLQEAEALEREQMRIEEEIQRLSAGSVLYMREIPNKPPPPYTPPGQALHWQPQKIQHQNPQPQWIVPRTLEQVIIIFILIHSK